MHAGERLPEGGSAPQMDPERRLWFDFLSKLNDRSIQEKRESGATGWVLIAAAVGILYKCVPLIPHFLSLPGALLTASVIFLLELDGLYFFCLAYFMGLHYSKEATDGRLEPGKVQRLTRAFYWILCFGALVLAAAHVRLAVRYALPGLVKWTLIVVGFLWAASSVFTIIVRGRKGFKARRIQTTLPQFSGIPMRRVVSGVNAGVYLALGIWVISALFAYLRSLSLSSIDWITPIAAASYLLALVAVVCILLIRGAFSQYRGAYLELERAILLEDLSPQEIRSRYETEMLGLAVGDWLKTLDVKVRREHAALKAALSSVRERTKEVEAIDPQYVLERIGRAKALADEWEKASDSLLSKLDAYNFQLDEGRGFPLSPPEREILLRVQSDWQELLEQAKEESHPTAAALKRLLALIKEGTDAQ